MNQKQIQDTAKKHEPKTHHVQHAVIAFVCGGVVGVIGQLLMMGYEMWFGVDQKTATSMCIVTIILLASFATGLGIYDKVAQKCGAGLFVPITGFANSLTSCAIEGRTEGLIYGIGSNMFKLAGSVLTYGVASAFIFGTIRYVLFGG